MSQELELDLKKLEAGDQETLNSLIEYLWPILLKSVRAYTHGYHSLSGSLDEIAFDVSSDVVMAIMRNPARLAALGSVDIITQYCLRLARNAVIHNVRREQKDQIVIGALEDAESSAQTPFTAMVDLAESHQMMERLTRAIAQLPPKERRAFRLHVMEGRPYKEVAEKMGISVESARWRVYDARQRLSEILKKEWIAIGGTNP
jgi:RNA polymerase sigma factor (sigma-70 family)